MLRIQPLQGAQIGRRLCEVSGKRQRCWLAGEPWHFEKRFRELMVEDTSSPLEDEFERSTEKDPFFAP